MQTVENGSIRHDLKSNIPMNILVVKMAVEKNFPWAIRFPSVTFIPPIPHARILFT